MDVFGCCLGLPADRSGHNLRAWDLDTQKEEPLRVACPEFQRCLFALPRGAFLDFPEGLPCDVSVVKMGRKRLDYRISGGFQVGRFLTLRAQRLKKFNLD